MSSWTGVFYRSKLALSSTAVRPSIVYYAIHIHIGIQFSILENNFQTGVSMLELLIYELAYLRSTFLASDKSIFKCQIHNKKTRIFSFSMESESRLKRKTIKSWVSLNSTGIEELRIGISLLTMWSSIVIIILWTRIDTLYNFVSPNNQIKFDSVSFLCHFY